jgi:hypothetical protein
LHQIRRVEPQGKPHVPIQMDKEKAGLTRASWRGLLIGLLILPAMDASLARPARRPSPATVQELPLPPPRPAIDQPPAAAAPPTPQARPDMPPAKPADGPAIPPSAPPVAAPAPPTAPVADCLQQLRERGAVVDVATPASLPDPRCTVDQPVTLTALVVPGMRIDFPDKPIIACATAQTFADFLSQFMVPLAKGTYGQPITSVGTGPGLECRPRNNVAGAKLSAHGQGLAIDIAQFRLGDGRLYRVGIPADQRDRDFDRAVRAGACGYFHTALGPGADEAHANHWHMDLEPRGSNGTSRFCQ